MELGTPLFLLPSLPTHSQFFSTVGLAWNAQTAEDFMQQPNYLITDNWITIGITETFLNRQLFTREANREGIPTRRSDKDYFLDIAILHIQRATFQVLPINCDFDTSDYSFFSGATRPKVTPYSVFTLHTQSNSFLF